VLCNTAFYITEQNKIHRTLASKTKDTFQIVLISPMSFAARTSAHGIECQLKFRYIFKLHSVPLSKRFPYDQNLKVKRHPFLRKNPLTSDINN